MSEKTSNGRDHIAEIARNTYRQIERKGNPAGKTQEQVRNDVRRAVERLERDR